MMSSMSRSRAGTSGSKQRQDIAGSSKPLPLADLEAFSLVRDDGDEIALTDAGAYWLHVVQDVFSIDGVGKLWSAAMREPWPKAVAL